MLAIDSSSKELSVALTRDDELVALVASEPGTQHSVQLFQHIREILEQNGIGLSAVDVYAVANGPGAFTALRVGLTVVKGLAEMQRKPVVPISVLEAVAESATNPGLLAPIIDAYRGQVFGGLYEKHGDQLVARGPERVLALEALLATLEAEGFRPDACTLVSPHLGGWSERIDATAFSVSPRENVSPQLAGAVARRARKKFAKGEVLDALRLEANYVRRSDAELLTRR